MNAPHAFPKADSGASTRDAVIARWSDWYRAQAARVNVMRELRGLKPRRAPSDTECNEHGRRMAQIIMKRPF